MIVGMVGYGDKVRFTYQKQDGTLSIREGTYVENRKGVHFSRVMTLETPEGAKSFKWEGIKSPIEKVE